MSLDVLTATIVPTVQALRDLHPGVEKNFLLPPWTTDQITILVEGAAVAGDGGGGYYWWDTTSTATDDGKVTVTPTSAPANGRWRRSSGAPGVLAHASADGTALTGTAAASLLPALAVGKLAANSMRVGKMYRIKAAGRISNIVTTPGTLTLDVRVNSTPIIAFNGGAMQLNAVAKTDVSWYLDLMLTIRTLGAATAANLLGQGLFTSESVVGSAVPGVGGNGSFVIPASAPAVGTGFDSTVENTIDLFGKFSLTGNSMQLHSFVLEALN